MHIPGQYEQYTDEKTLFIVAGSRSAHLFAAHNGELNEIASIDTPRPEYSDNEGFFERGGGSSYASGGSHEENKKEITGQFLKMLTQHLLSLEKESYSAVIVCAPSYALPEITGSIPQPLARLIRVTIEGNYTSSSPLELIRTLQGDLEKARTKLNESIASPEAQKLLHKTEE